MYQPLLALWVLGPLLLSLAEKNAEVEDSQYWQLCGEEYKGYCYHGGVCRYYRFQNVTMWRCECNVQNSGRRCELIVRPPFRSTPRVTVAHVAAGVGVAVFVTIVLLIAVIAYIQYKRKRHRREIRLDNPENEIGQPFTRRASVIGSDSRRGVPNSNGHADEKPMLEKPILNNDAETTTTV